MPKHVLTLGRETNVWPFFFFARGGPRPGEVAAQRHRYQLPPPAYPSAMVIPPSGAVAVSFLGRTYTLPAHVRLGVNNPDPVATIGRVSRFDDVYGEVEDLNPLTGPLATVEFSTAEPFHLIRAASGGAPVGIVLRLDPRPGSGADVCVVEAWGMRDLEGFPRRHWPDPSAGPFVLAAAELHITWTTRAGLASLPREPKTPGTGALMARENPPGG